MKYFIYWELLRNKRLLTKVFAVATPLEMTVINDLTAYNIVSWQKAG